MVVTLAEPSTNITFPANKSDSASDSSVLIPQEVIVQAQTGNYVATCNHICSVSYLFHCSSN